MSNRRHRRRARRNRVKMAALKAATLNIPDKENRSTPIAQSPPLTPPEGEQPTIQERILAILEEIFSSVFPPATTLRTFCCYAKIALATAARRAHILCARSPRKHTEGNVIEHGQSFPVGWSVAQWHLPQESSSVRSAGTLPIESM